MAKKKLIRVEGLSKSPYGLGNSICFALVSNPKEGKRKQATSLFSCRDYISDTLRAVVHERSTDGHYAPTVDMTKLRLLIAKGLGKNKKEREEFKERVFSAKRLLNLYEDMAGWEKPSKITTVVMENAGFKYAWLLTGPAEWLSYSQLTSMVTLIFRSIGNFGPIEFHDLDSAEEWFENLLNKYKEEKASGTFRYDPDLDTYLRVSYEKFPMLMQHYKEIFTQPLKEAYPRDGSVHGPGGIYHLCSFNTGNAVLDRNMSETWKRYKEERKRRINRRTERHLEKAKGSPSL